MVSQKRPRGAASQTANKRVAPLTNTIQVRPDGPKENLSSCSDAGKPVVGMYEKLPTSDSSSQPVTTSKSCVGQADGEPVVTGSNSRVHKCVEPLSMEPGGDASTVVPEWAQVLLSRLDELSDKAAQDKLNKLRADMLDNIAKEAGQRNEAILKQRM